MGFRHFSQINPPSSKGHKFILVAVDYFTKWVKAKALKEVIHNEVIDFVEEQILQKFGIPESLTIDQGTMFTGRKVVKYANLRNIKLITLTPYYAQANGYVEAVNKTIVDLIKKNVGR